MALMATLDWPVPTHVDEVKVKTSSATGASASGDAGPSSMEMVDMLAAVIEPKQGSAVITEVSRLLPLPSNLIHMKRAMRRAGDPSLLVALCSREFAEANADIVAHVTSALNIAEVQTVQVPAHPHTDRAALEAHKAANGWPVSFQRASPGSLLSTQDVATMCHHMRRVIATAADSHARNCALIVDGETDAELVCVVDGRRPTAPLDHAFMVGAAHIADAVAAAKAKVRVAVAHDDGICASVPVKRKAEAMESEDTKTEAPRALELAATQYLCTGYDVYLLREPCPMCAMAMVHSRVRRVIYALPDPVVGALGSKLCLHGLGGINHRYQVFKGLFAAQAVAQCGEQA